VEANLETSLFEPSINILHVCPKSIILIQHTEGAKNGEGNLLSMLSAIFFGDSRAIFTIAAMVSQSSRPTNLSIDIRT
jgi:hypothetical protein